MMMLLTCHPEIQGRQQGEHIRLDVGHQQLDTVDEDDENHRKH